MSIVLNLISGFAWAFYLACGIAAVYFLVALGSAWRDYTRSAYYLERETSRSKIASALSRVLFCAAAAGVIWFIASQAPEAPAAASSAGGAIGKVSTPVAPFTPQVVFAPGAGPTAAIAATAPVTRAASLPAGTATVQPAGGGLPTNNCGSQMAQILAAEAPRKTLTVTGTALLETGGQWRVELLPPNNAGAIQLQRGDTSASNTALVRAFGLNSFQSGTYGVRVTSLRSDGSVLATCQRSVGLGN